jgi:hypothetical protein
MWVVGGAFICGGHDLKQYLRWWAGCGAMGARTPVLDNGFYWFRNDAYGLPVAMSPVDAGSESKFGPAGSDTPDVLFEKLFELVSERIKQKNRRYGDGMVRSLNEHFNWTLESFAAMKYDVFDASISEVYFFGDSHSRVPRTYSDCLVTLSLCHKLVKRLKEIQWSDPLFREIGERQRTGRGWIIVDKQLDERTASKLKNMWQALARCLANRYTTAASPIAQPAIVKIRRVDALIIIIILLPAAIPIAARLYAFAALLLLVDQRADKYTAIAPPPPPRVRRAAAPRSPRCRRVLRVRRAFAFAFTLVPLFTASRGPLMNWCKWTKMRLRILSHTDLMVLSSYLRPGVHCLMTVTLTAVCCCR